jgi:flagellar hook assembly protein FlgD
VKTLFDGEAAAGINEHVWDGTDEAGERVPAGLYFTRVSARGMKDSRRVILID